MCSRTVVLALLVALCAFQAFAEQTPAEKLEAAGFTYLGPFIGAANAPTELFISSHFLNFTAALQYCFDSDAKLVAVERPYQQQYINFAMANMYPFPKSPPPAWTSALYNPGQEIWIWRSVNRKMEYQFWRGSSPPSNPKGGDCGFIQTDFFVDAVLESFPCNIPLQFICEA